MYGLRSAIGVGHFAYFAERQNTSGTTEVFESSDFDVGTVAEYYLSASYRISEQLSLRFGLYRLRRSVLRQRGRVRFAGEPFCAATGGSSFWRKLPVLGGEASWTAPGLTCQFDLTADVPWVYRS